MKGITTQAELSGLFSDIRAFVCDLDGTLIRGEQAIEGAHETVRMLQGCYSVIFLTNNSTRSREYIHAKLNRLGFICDLGDVYCPASSAAAFLCKSGLDQVYVIGSQEFADSIAAGGAAVVPADSAEVVLVGLDTGFNYAKIADALAILGRGGRFVVCNEDASYPVESGRLLPGCGAMVGAIRAASGRAPDAIIGKPESYMLHEIASARHLQPHQVMVVGDVWSSDIQLARGYGCPAIWLHENKTDQPLPIAAGVLRVQDHVELKRYCRDLLPSLSAT